MLGTQKETVITKGGICRISTSLESLDSGWVLLCFPPSGASLESLVTLNSLESLEMDIF